MLYPTLPPVWLGMTQGFDAKFGPECGEFQLMILLLIPCNVYFT